MSENKRNVVLDMSHGGLTSLLRETVRATLHGSNPSAFIRHVLEGIYQYRQENMQTESTEDRRLMCEMEHRLRVLHEDLRRMEDLLYPQPECPPYPVSV